MPSRRSHTKSRHGCLECKARKVKCDQVKPICARCTRSEQSCHYGIISVEVSPRPLSVPSGRETTPLTNFPWSISSRFSSPSLIDPCAAQQRTFTAVDLELMHHYSTAAFLPHTPTAAEFDVWQRLAPEEAFKHQFLLHGILAISALHKAHQAPDMMPELILLAMQHYTVAITLFRPVLTNIQPGNAVAAFMLSGLVVCISWALPMAHPDSAGNIPVLTIDDILQHIVSILQLLRGVRGVVERSWTSPWTRQLAPIFELVTNEPDAVFPPEEEAILEALRQRVHAYNSTPPEKNMYDETLQQFRTFWPLDHGPHAHGLVHAWTTRIPSEFLNAILEKKPPALLILAYHGALVHELKDCWWVGNKGRLIVQTVGALLPPGYEDIMEWPKNRTCI